MWEGKGQKGQLLGTSIWNMKKIIGIIEEKEQE